MIARAAPLAVALGTVAWSTPTEAQAPAASLLAAERELAETSAREGLAAALTAALHPSAVLVWPGAPVAEGADAPRLLMSQALLDSVRVDWQALALEISGDSALAVTWGVAVGTDRRMAGAPWLGRYISAWVRDRGSWRIAAVQLSGVLPPQETVIPAGLPRRRPPLSPAGSAAPFTAADLAFARLAADSGPGIAFERFAAPEAAVLDGQGLLVRGPKAIGSLVAGPAAWRWHPVAAGAAPGGDLGWTVGEAEIVPHEGEPVYSKYLTVWRRRADGSIRYLTDGGNPRPRP